MLPGTKGRKDGLDWSRACSLPPTSTQFCVGPSTWQALKAEVLLWGPWFVPRGGEAPSMAGSRTLTFCMDVPVPTSTRMPFSH